MAVTYSWRIDSDKYAYLFPPVSGVTFSNSKPSGITVEEWKTYGFLSKTPLTDYYALTVAQTANETFGENSGKGLEEYQKAFEVVRAKIAAAAADRGYSQTIKGNTTYFVWEGANNYDMLSADVYFKVDAAACADLRGVGIKGTRYLGSISGQTYRSDNIEPTEYEGRNLNDLSYIPEGENIPVVIAKPSGGTETINTKMKPGIPGFTDVYGIFMTDTIEEGISGKTVEDTVPEYMFVIRNGKEGALKEVSSNNSGETSGGASQESVTQLQQQITQLEEELEKAKSNIETLANWINNIGSIDRLASNVKTLQQDVKNLQNIVKQIQGGDGDDSTGTGNTTVVTGSVQIVYAHQGAVNGQLGGGTSGGTVNMVGNNATEENDNYYNLGESIYLLGYVPQKGNTQYVKASKLIALPYISVNNQTIKFDTNFVVGGNTKISGDLLVTGTTQTKDLKVTGTGETANLNVINAINAGIMYSKNGYYQEAGTLTTVASAEEIQDPENPSVNIGDVIYQ